jgi:hypothetical protein
MMSSPPEVVRWECGTCAYTNKNSTCHECLACQTRSLVRYAIVASATEAMTARIIRVDCCKQACIAALATAGPVVYGEAATSANGTVAGEAPNAANRPPAVAGSAAMHRGWAPQVGGNGASIAACLVSTMVDIVGTSAKDRGCNFPYPCLLWDAAPGEEQGLLPPGVIDLL